MWGWFLIAGTVLAVVFVYVSQRRRPQRLYPESLFNVSFDSIGILITDPTGEFRRVPWNQLTKVAIRTTDDGPFNPDVFWGFHTGSDEPAAVFPGGATGEAELLAELQHRLSGFDNDQMIEAMRSTSNALFVLWNSKECP